MIKLAEIAYTIGIKGLFSFKKYKILNHRLETWGSTPQLILTLVDGSAMIILSPKLVYRTYDDYRLAELKQKQLKREQEYAQANVLGGSLQQSVS
jgi:hypothetical protein